MKTLIEKKRGSKIKITGVEERVIDKYLTVIHVTTNQACHVRQGSHGISGTVFWFGPEKFDDYKNTQSIIFPELAPYGNHFFYKNTVGTSFTILIVSEEKYYEGLINKDYKEESD